MKLRIKVAVVLNHAEALKLRSYADRGDATTREMEAEKIAFLERYDQLMAKADAVVSAGD